MAPALAVSLFYTSWPRQAWWTQCTRLHALLGSRCRWRRRTRRAAPPCKPRSECRCWCCGHGRRMHVHGKRLCMADPRASRLAARTEALHSRFISAAHTQLPGARGPKHTHTLPVTVCVCVP